MPAEHIPSEVERQARVDEIYQAALTQHEKFKEVPAAVLKETISTALKEIDALESVAENNYTKIPMNATTAEDIKLIWVVPGPGSFDSARKEDRYKQYDWAEWMDHDRLTYGARLARAIAEQKSGETVRRTLGEIKKAKARTRELIEEYAPPIFYNGTKMENEVVADVAQRPGTIVPPNKVVLSAEEIATTADQVKKFNNADGALPPDAPEIAIVSHAPHLARIMRMINKYRPLPEGTQVRVFPLPTPAQGKREYAKIEVMGILYYAYLAPEQSATPEPYPAVIAGTK